MRHFDSLENCDPSHRHANLYSRLADMLRHAIAAPAYAECLKGINPATIVNASALATLPVLRKSDLPALQKARLPFGGLVLSPQSCRIVRAAVHLPRSDL